MNRPRKRCQGLNHTSRPFAVVVNREPMTPGRTTTVPRLVDSALSRAPPGKGPPTSPLTTSSLAFPRTRMARRMARTSLVVMASSSSAAGSVSSGRTPSVSLTAPSGFSHRSRQPVTSGSVQNWLWHTPKLVSSTSRWSGGMWNWSQRW